MTTIDRLTLAVVALGLPAMSPAARASAADGGAMTLLRCSAATQRKPYDGGHVSLHPRDDGLTWTARWRGCLVVGVIRIAGKRYDWTAFAVEACLSGRASTLVEAAGQLVCCLEDLGQP